METVRDNISLFDSGAIFTFCMIYGPLPSRTVKYSFTTGKRKQSFEFVVTNVQTEKNYKSLLVFLFLLLLLSHSYFFQEHSEPINRGEY